MNSSLLRKRLMTIGAIIIGALLIGNVATQRTSQGISTPTPAPKKLKQSQIANLLDQLAPPNITIPQPNRTVPAVYAKSYILIDGETKYALASKQPDTPVPIASTTKIMTALVTLETQPLTKVVTVSAKAATTPGSESYLMTGEKITIENLLYALLLNSGNDAAQALAEVEGSSEAFVAKMNAKAQLLGLKNTAYKDPAGLDDTGRSTPRDLAILTHYALSNDTFRSIIKTSKMSITSADNRYIHELKNSNRLINPEEPLFHPSSMGGKTGFTYEAGHCLVSAATAPNGKQYIAVVLHTSEDTKEASAREVRKLLVWAEHL